MSTDQGTPGNPRGVLRRCPGCGSDVDGLIPAYRGRPGQSSCEDCFEKALAADDTRHGPTIRERKQPRAYEPSVWRAERAREDQQ